MKKPTFPNIVFITKMAFILDILAFAAVVSAHEYLSHHYQLFPHRLDWLITNVCRKI